MMMKLQATGPRVGGALVVKWSELKWASNFVLAVRPHYRTLFERWFMQ
jgi:hypothetical protein